MLTVKTIDRYGIEVIFPAIEVSSLQEKQIPDSPYDCPPGVHVKLSDGAIRHYPWGQIGSSDDLYKPVIYVMNEHGKTVATYKL